MISRRKFLFAATTFLLAPISKMFGKEEVDIINKSFYGQSINVTGKSYFNCFFQDCKFIGNPKWMENCFIVR